MMSVVCILSNYKLGQHCQTLTLILKDTTKLKPKPATHPGSVPACVVSIIRLYYCNYLCSNIFMHGSGEAMEILNLEIIKLESF